MAAGKPYSQLLFPVRFLTYTFTSDIVYTLFTTAQIVFPAVPGITIFPLFVHIGKEAGTSYTIGAATGIELRYTNGAGPLIWHGAITGFLNQTPAAMLAGLGYTAANSAVFSALSNVENAPIVAFIPGGNVSVGTGSLRVTVLAALLPTAQLGME